MKWHRLVCLLKGHKEGYPTKENDPFSHYKNNENTKTSSFVRPLKVRWSLLQYNEGTGGFLTTVDLRYCKRCGDAFMEVS